MITDGNSKNNIVHICAKKTILVTKMVLTNIEVFINDVIWAYYYINIIFHNAFN